MKKSNNDGCWKKSMQKLVTIATENPKVLDWWAKMKIKYGTDNIAQIAIERLQDVEEKQVQSFNDRVKAAKNSKS